MPAAVADVPVHFENSHPSAIEAVVGDQTFKLPPARKAGGRTVAGRLEVPRDQAPALRARLGKVCEGDAPLVRVIGL